MPTKRQILVRRNFEAYRDLTWFAELEPKFRERGIEGKELQSFREMWNEHAEKRDWEWWQKETARKASGRLKDEIMDITDRLDQLGCLTWLEDQKQRESKEDFKQILTETAAKGGNKEQEKGQER